MRSINFIVFFLFTLCLHVPGYGQLGVSGGDIEPVGEEDLGDADYFYVDCTNDSLEALPLMELGAAYYYSYQGGLFPGGSNADPNPHLTNGKNISKSIKPRNSAGEVDYVNGDVILLGIGPSVASDPYNEWKETQRDLDWPGTNPCLQVKGNFIGGKNTSEMLDIGGTYWSNFSSGLDAKAIEPEQVQIAWMLLMSNTDSMDLDYYIDTVTKEYIQIIQNLQTILPNLQQIFISGVHYTGYTSQYHHRYNYIVEPFGYWSNLVVKNVIGLQINGDTRLDYLGEDKVAPFITWGPYFWADGITPRASDDLSWQCHYFRDDTIGGGFHLKDEYKYLEGDLIDDFFNTNAISRIWYKDGAAWTACGTPRMEETDDALSTDENTLMLYPNPVAAILHVEVPPHIMQQAQVQIFNSAGKLVHTQIFDASKTIALNIDMDDWPGGMYFVRMYTHEAEVTGICVRQ